METRGLHEMLTAARKQLAQHLTAIVFSPDFYVNVELLCAHNKLARNGGGSSGAGQRGITEVVEHNRGQNRAKC